MPLLGHQLRAEERSFLPDYLKAAQSQTPIPPPAPVRTPAEWEEAQALLIAWTSFPEILSEIVRYAALEVPVYIVTQNSTTVLDYLNNKGISTDNVFFINAPFNSIWIRDYGPWSVYKNQVDSLWIVDWIYNRPRPKDDAVPAAVAETFGLPFYEATAPPTDLIHTGGNFMVDGWGTGFSSELIVEENPDKSLEEIQGIMQQYLGINRYVLMETLPYDEIHHIDMHMKLLNEETLLVGQYPEGVADGPQIEENIAYIQNNYLTAFGNPYHIVRIPMPADAFGSYPDDYGDYRTLTNSIFINKTLLVPVYESSDSSNLDILRQHLPAYKIVGIDCNDIITSLGALHCITKLVMSDDPLWISLPLLADMHNVSGDYNVKAHIEHRSGIAEAILWYRTDSTQNFTAVPMQEQIAAGALFNFVADIPQQADSSTVQYYISATSNSGKSQVRPITAPAGFYSFDVYGGDEVGLEQQMLSIRPENLMLSPNPVQALANVYISNPQTQFCTIELSEISGKTIQSVFSGMLNAGKHRFELDTQHLAAGMYWCKWKSERGEAVVKPLVVVH